MALVNIIKVFGNCHQYHHGTFDTCHKYQELVGPFHPFQELDIPSHKLPCAITSHTAPLPIPCHKNNINKYNNNLSIYGDLLYLENIYFLTFFIKAEVTRPTVISISFLSKKFVFHHISITWFETFLYYPHII